MRLHHVFMKNLAEKKEFSEQKSDPVSMMCSSLLYGQCTYPPKTLRYLADKFKELREMSEKREELTSKIVLMKLDEKDKEKLEKIVKERERIEEEYNKKSDKLWKLFQRLDEEETNYLM